MNPLSRLQELYTFIFPPNPKPPTPEERLAKAKAEFCAAKAWYGEAYDVGDKRGMGERFPALYRARNELESAYLCSSQSHPSPVTETVRPGVGR